MIFCMGTGLVLLLLLGLREILGSVKKPGGDPAEQGGTARAGLRQRRPLHLTEHLPLAPPQPRATSPTAGEDDLLGRPGDRVHALHEASGALGHRVQGGAPQSRR